MAPTATPVPPTPTEVPAVPTATPVAMSTQTPDTSTQETTRMFFVRYFAFAIFGLAAGAAIVDAQDEGMVRANLVRVIQPISGKVTILKMDPVRDASGHIVAYRALVRK